MINEMESISILPNPTKGIVLFHGIEDEIFELSVYDSFGKLVKEKIRTPSQVDLSNLVNGIYFISIKTNNQMVIRKVLKN